MEINKIHNVECLGGMREVGDSSIDLIVTDPPYYIENLKENMKEQTLRRSSKNNIFYNEFDHFDNLEHFQSTMRAWLKEFNRILKDKAQVYMFCSYHHLDWMIKMIKDEGFRFFKPLIWYKPDTMGVFPNQYGCNYEVVLWFRKRGKTGHFKNHIGCGQRDVFTQTSTNIKYREECGFHPTPKPINIIRQLIKNGSDAGDLILDPFVGSGTTAVAAKQEGRAYLGFEINKAYCEISQRRLAQETIGDSLKKYMEVEKDEFKAKDSGDIGSAGADPKRDKCEDAGCQASITAWSNQPEHKEG